MPWAKKDVDRFKRGLSDKQKEKWVKIANEILKKCSAEGGDILECEALAIRTANSKFSKNESNADLSRDPIKLDREKGASLALAEVNYSAFESSPQAMEAYQLVLPIGLYTTARYGEVIFTKTFMERLVENAERRGGPEKVWLDTNHDFGEANAWAEDIVVTEDGLAVKWNFNELGRQRINDKRYRFYSASLVWELDPETGEELAPVLATVSFTNYPAMPMLPGAHLSRATFGSDIVSGRAGDDENNLAHSDEGESNEEGAEMEIKLSDVLSFMLNGASDSDRAAIVNQLGLSDVTNKNKELQAQVDNLTTKLESQTEAYSQAKTALDKIQKQLFEQRKSTAIEKALEEGRIKPADREKWEARFDKNPEYTEEILADLPKVIDYDESDGHGAGGNEADPNDQFALSDEQRRLIGLPEKKGE